MKIKELEIEKFRGIKDLIKINLDEENLVIFGPNGTGKSAIVDAIDFLLTGKISRLTGEGTKGLKLKEHGGHIDNKNDFINSKVSAKININNKEVIIERTMNNPNHLTVSPKEYEKEINSNTKIASLGQHILSRKDILRYITSEAGKRAKEIQSLLDLKNIEDLRTDLVNIKNDAEEEHKTMESNLGVVKENISTLLSLNSFSEKSAFQKINELRKILGGSEIDEMDSEKIKRNLVYNLTIKKSLNDEQIKNIINNTEEIISEGGILSTKQMELIKLLDEIKKEKKFNQYLLYKNLLEVGITLAGESNVCPLCEKPWTDGELKDFLEERAKEMSITKEKQEKIDEISLFIKKKCDLLINNLDSLSEAHKQFKLNTFYSNDFEKVSLPLKEWSTKMIKPLELIEERGILISKLKEIFESPILKSSFLIPLEGALKKSDGKLSKQLISWDVLTKMEEKWKDYRKALEKKDNAEIFKKRAIKLLDYFIKSRDGVLKQIYNSLKGDLEKYYKAIHLEDEKEFSSKISHISSELNIEVDFYGRGMFPPHALHSEGHQDSMGLCLFLALNKYLSGSKLDIIVLDDVVMSIDRDHRRAICDLIKEFFPNKQFIITTHDSVWARQLKTEKIVSKKNMLHFFSWNIDVGPSLELDSELWAKINEDLSKNDVPSAAHKLRRNAECFFENVCHCLHSTELPYNEEHKWEFGDFAKAAISSFKRYIKKSKVYFQEHNQQEKLNKLNEFEKVANKIIEQSKVEQWVINENVHYNHWEEFSKNDFTPVVNIFKNLFGLFICSNCGNNIKLNKDSDGSELVACGCGDIFWKIK